MLATGAASSGWGVRWPTWLVGLVGLLAVQLGACARPPGAPSRGAVGAQAAAQGDPRGRPQPQWKAIAQQLPRGADTCVWAEPSALAPERREQFALASQLPAGVWEPSLRAYAVAVVERRRRGGRRSRVLAVQSSLEGPALRAALDGALGLDLDWAQSGRVGRPTGHPCGPDACPMQATLVLPNLAVLRSGEWLSPADAVGVEGQCAKLAQDRPGGLEWSVTRGQSLRLAAGPMMPMRTAMMSRAGMLAVRRTRRDRMVNGDLAVEAARSQDVSVPGIERQLERRREGRVVVTETELLWDDLRLRLGDRRRLAAAAADAEGILGLEPGADTDVSQLEAVRAELSYRLAMLDVGEEARRSERRRGVIALLRRAVTQHPGELGLSRTLVEMLIAEPQGAAEAARRAAGLMRDREHGEEFHDLRMHALALSDERAFAAGLAADGHVRRAVAGQAASAIAGLLRAGRDYDQALVDWSVAARMHRSTRRVPLRPTRPVSLPLSAVADGLLALRYLAGVSGPMVALLLHDGRGGPPTSEGVSALGERTLVRAVADVRADGGGEVRAVGEMLRVWGEGQGPLEWVLQPEPGDGGPIRLRGEVQGDRFILQASDAPSASLDWALLSQRLFEPLAMSAGGEFHLPMPDSASARAALRLVSGAFSLPCSYRDAELRCRTDGAFSDRARAALLALSAEALQAPARRLWVR